LDFAVTDPKYNVVGRIREQIVPACRELEDQRTKVCLALPKTLLDGALRETFEPSAAVLDLKVAAQGR